MTSSNGRFKLKTYCYHWKKIILHCSPVCNVKKDNISPTLSLLLFTQKLDVQRSKGQNEPHSIRLYILWSNNKQIVCTHLRISVEMFDKHVWYLINVNNLIIFDDIGLLYNDMLVFIFYISNIFYQMFNASFK